MNESQSNQAKNERRFPWRGCLGIAALLLLLTVLLLPGVCGPGPGAAKRASARIGIVSVCSALKQYYTEYGALPPGNHAQIMAALRGNNPLKIVFFEADPKRFNAQGESLDPWHTPYHIDASNPAFPWAYSFGKDRKDDGGVPGSDDIPSWR